MIKGSQMTIEARQKISKSLMGNHYAKGFRHTDETKRKVSLASKRQDHSWKLGLKRSEQSCKKQGETLHKNWQEGKYIKLNRAKGEHHWNWKGGINPVNDTIRKSTEMKLVKRACFERDSFTCQECNQIGGELSAHHIKPFSLFPELRFALDNLVTLCKSCHLKTDTYAGRVISYIQNNVYHT